MTSKQRMITAMKNGQADYVPVAPDISNMIPCRLTGKPLWDIYLFQDPPLFEAYTNAVKYFGFDGWQPAAPAEFDHEIEENAGKPVWQEAIVRRTADRIYTRLHATIDGVDTWTDFCHVYPIDNPPTANVPLEKVGLPAGTPTEYEDVHPKNNYKGLEGYYKAVELMGEDGVVGISVGLPGLHYEENAITDFYYHPEETLRRCEETHQWMMRRTEAILKIRPDFLMIGISGFMIFNPEPIFRQLSIKTLKEVTALCKKADIPSQIHCCGPSYSLVKIAAEESDLSSINPLEIPPMGDCILADVKKQFGQKLSLMGNLHTVNVMLNGTPEDVRRESKKAIDDAAAGGGFILSTGDQCGRDTPDENIFAMVEVARSYGKY